MRQILISHLISWLPFSWHAWLQPRSLSLWHTILKYFQCTFLPLLIPNQTVACISKTSAYQHMMFGKGACRVTNILTKMPETLYFLNICLPFNNKTFNQWTKSWIPIKSYAFTSFQYAKFYTGNTFIDQTLTLLIYYFYTKFWLLYSSWWMIILNHQMLLLPASYLCTAAFVQLFEYFITFYVLTYKMSRK